MCSLRRRQSRHLRSGRLRRAYAAGHSPLGEAARGCVGVHELGQVARGTAVRGGERLLDDLRDPEEGEPPFEECCDRDLVRGVEDARVGAAELARTARQGEQRERLQVRCGELESQTAGQVQARHVRFGPFRIRERERDRDGHVGVAEVRKRGAVAEADERVHDRARVHDDLDPLVRDAEEEVRLDQLEALVRERRGVDRDLRPHAPGGVRERVLDADVSQIGPGAAAERPARGGQHERVDRLRLAPLEALEERRVLGVDRQQQASSPLPRLQRQGAGGDEALLVRERERDPALERPQGCADPGEADHRIQDDVRRRGLEQLREVAADLRVRDGLLRGERGEVGRPGGKSAQLELRVPLHDLDRLPANRAGGAEQRDSFHGHSVPYASAMTT